MNNCARPECTFEANENVAVFNNFCCLACKKKGKHGPVCGRKIAKCISPSCSYNRNKTPNTPESKYCCTKCKENKHAEDCAHLTYESITPIKNDDDSLSLTTKARATTKATTKATTLGPILFYNAQTETFNIIATKITPKPMFVQTGALSSDTVSVAASYSNGSSNRYLYAYIAYTSPDLLILPTLTPADLAANKPVILTATTQLTWITNTTTYSPTQYIISGPVKPPILYVSVLYTNDGINLMRSNVCTISPLPSAITISKGQWKIIEEPIEGYIGGKVPYILGYSPMLNIYINKGIFLTKMTVTPNSAASPNIPPLLLNGKPIMPQLLIIQSKTPLSDANMNMQYFFNNYTDFSKSSTIPFYCPVNSCSTTGVDLFSLGNWFCVMAQDSKTSAYFFSKNFFWDLSLNEYPKVLSNQNMTSAPAQ